MKESAAPSHTPSIQEQPDQADRPRTARRPNPIRALLCRPISFHPVLVDVCEGSINAALLLSQAIYWSEITRDPSGWFYKKSADWEKETRLSRREQDTARTRLKRVGVLKEKLRGTPPVMHYKVDFDQLTTAILNLPESARLAAANAQINLAQRARSYEETEITAQSTKKREQDPANSSESARELGKDPRFRPLVEELFSLYTKYNQCASTEVPFNGKQAKQLQRFLVQHGKLTCSLLTSCIKNRFSSEAINVAEPFERWAFNETLLSYRNGPLDRFGKPLSPAPKPQFKSCSEKMRQSLTND